MGRVLDPALRSSERKSLATLRFCLCVHNAEMRAEVYAYGAARAALKAPPVRHVALGGRLWRLIDWSLGCRKLAAGC